jgi:hypothetical protein
MPMARSPGNRDICSGEGGARNSTVRSPAFDKASSTSVDPRKIIAVIGEKQIVGVVGAF